MGKLDPTQPDARDARDIRGRLFDIQRFSINDGPGIRTTVFLKGCPLQCVWCHNPEGISPERQLSYEPSRCIGCGYCAQACARGAHRMADGKHVYDRSACGVCLTCTEKCYAGALEPVGRDATVAEVIDEVRKDEPFYRTSGGGMTLSGGEPTAQINFAAALLAEARRHHLHTAIETCGFCPWDRLERILDTTDLFLYDLKAHRDDLHRRLTGVPLEPILANLRHLNAAGAAIWLRLPLVPELNVCDEHFQLVASLVAECPRIEKVHVLPYHPLATGKYARLGIKPPDTAPPEIRRPTDEDVQSWLAQLADLGIRAELA